MLLNHSLIFGLTWNFSHKNKTSMRNFFKKNDWKWTLYEKETCHQSSLHSKNGRILSFELLPNIQNNLDWHANFTTISILQGEQNPTNFIKNEQWMKEIQGPEVAALKCSLVNSNWSCELWLASKKLDWSQNFTIQTIREIATFPTSLIEFGPWMQNL